MAKRKIFRAIHEDYHVHILRDPDTGMAYCEDWSLRLPDGSTIAHRPVIDGPAHLMRDSTGAIESEMSRYIVDGVLVDAAGRELPTTPPEKRKLASLAKPRPA